MSIGVWYWLVMFIWLIFGLWRARGEVPPYYGAGGHLLMFILFVLLGLKVFGSPVQ